MLRRASTQRAQRRVEASQQLDPGPVVEPLAVRRRRRPSAAPGLGGQLGDQRTDAALPPVDGGDGVGGAGGQQVPLTYWPPAGGSAGPTAPATCPCGSRTASAARGSRISPRTKPAPSPGRHPRGAAPRPPPGAPRPPVRATERFSQHVRGLFARMTNRPGRSGPRRFVISYCSPHPDEPRGDGLLAKLPHASCRDHQEPPPPPPAPPPTPPPPPAPAPAPAPAAREDGLTPEMAKPATKTGP